jgi:O-antigen biosynthesis protein
VYNTGKRVLEECIASVLSQTMNDWELCLIDDHSTNEATVAVLKKAAALDSRILVRYRETNGGIVAASNDGVAIARGAYVALLDHDDVLEPDALEEIALALKEDPAIDYLYTDEDLLSEKGKTREAFRKPDWSPERFRSQMYVCHFSVIRRSLLDEVGGFRPGFDGSQDYDLMLRVTERAKVIHHIPKILYHWRIIEGSVAGDPDAKPYAYVAGENALRDHLSRVGISASVSAHEELPGNYVVKRAVPADLPSISLFYIDRRSNSSVWGRERDNSRETLLSLSSKSSYPSLDISPLTLGQLDSFETLNQAVASCSNDFMVLASDALEVDTPDWCETLFSFMQQDDVGMVIPYLWTANSRLFHAGFNLRPHCLETAGARISREFTGFRAVFRCDREVSAVGAFCTLVRKEAFIRAGGFDSNLPSPYSEADLSLRIRELGYRLIATPQAHMWCFEDNNDYSSGRYRMISEFRSRWRKQIDHDPFAGLAPENDCVIDPRPRWIPKRLRHFN